MEGRATRRPLSEARRTLFRVADPWSEESVYPPPMRWRSRTALVVSAVAGVVGGGWAFADAVHDVSATSVCRYDEAREGVLGEDKIGLPAARVPAGWTPGVSYAVVRHVESDQPTGTVLDHSWCLSRHHGRLVVVVAR